MKDLVEWWEGWKTVSTEGCVRGRERRYAIARSDARWQVFKETVESTTCVPYFVHQHHRLYWCIILDQCALLCVWICWGAFKNSLQLLSVYFAWCSVNRSARRFDEWVGLQKCPEWRVVVSQSLVWWNLINVMTIVCVCVCLCQQWKITLSLTSNTCHNHCK